MSTTYKRDNLTIYDAGTLRLPEQPRASDRTTEQVLIYNPAARVLVFAYGHRPRMASQLLALGGVHTFEADADGIERQCYRFSSVETRDAAAKLLQVAREKRDGAWVSTESHSVNLLPGLTLVSAERWRLIRSQSTVDVLAKVKLIARLKTKGDRQTLVLESGVDARQLAHAITGDGRRDGDSGTGDRALLDRLLEHKLDDVVAKAIDKQRDALKRPAAA